MNYRRHSSNQLYKDNNVHILKRSDLSTVSQNRYRGKCEFSGCTCKHHVCKSKKNSTNICKNCHHGEIWHKWETDTPSEFNLPIINNKFNNKEQEKEKKKKKLKKKI